jgi:hypothetical protein
MIDKSDIHNNEAQKKMSVFLHLRDIIGTEPHWQFPLNKERLDELLHSDFSKGEENDFKAVFWFAIEKMKKNGVQFILRVALMAGNLFIGLTLIFGKKILNSQLLKKKNLYLKKH